MQEQRSTKRSLNTLRDALKLNSSSAVESFRDLTGVWYCTTSVIIGREVVASGRRFLLRIGSLE